MTKYKLIFTVTNKSTFWSVRSLLCCRARRPHESITTTTKSKQKKFYKQKKLQQQKNKWIIMYWLLCIREQIHLRSFLLKNTKKNKQKKLSFWDFFFLSSPRVNNSLCRKRWNLFQISIANRHTVYIFFRFHFPVIITPFFSH